MFEEMPEEVAKSGAAVRGHSYLPDLLAVNPLPLRWWLLFLVVDPDTLLMHEKPLHKSGNIAAGNVTDCCSNYFCLPRIKFGGHCACVPMSVKRLAQVSVSAGAFTSKRYVPCAQNAVRMPAERLPAPEIICEKLLDGLSLPCW